METLNDVLDASARRFGEAPALMIKPGFRTRVWTYRDLADLVPRVGCVLQRWGVQRGDRVIVWGVPRPEWGIAYFALLRIGAIVVPLDWRSHPDFAAKVRDRTRAAWVLASPQVAAQAHDLGLPMRIIEELPDAARGLPALPKPEPAPDEVVEVIYTSGTTGDPKGVMVTHRNILSNALAVTQVFPVGPEERLLTVLPLSHMFAQTTTLVAPLIAGTSVAYGTSLQPAALLRAFREYRPTIFVIVPAGLRLFEHAILRKVDAEGRRKTYDRLHRWARRLPLRLRRYLFLPVHAQFGGRLRVLGVGAAPLDRELGERWQEMGFEVLEGYGATECSPAIAFNPPGRNRLGTVGPALPGVDVRIAEDGEVLVRGPNVFQGYFENEEATRAVLIDGWYHTGDLGELDRDGYITLKGRKKDMLAMPDGTKVYPDDVEAILLRDARLRDAAVIGLERAGEDFHVHAVLLLDDHSAAQAIVEAANARLGSHQRIRGYEVWPDDDFPRTMIGKVMKRVVLERVQQGGAAPTAPAGTAPDAPAAAARSDVARLAAEVAKVAPSSVKPESRLASDLVLDSLGRIELLTVIEEELGAYVDDAVIEPDTTIAELERLVQQAKLERRSSGLYEWPLNPVVRSVGLVLQELVLWPLTRVFYRIKVTGREKLRDLKGPVLFTPNHCLHYDNGIILSAIPLRWRWHLTVAAAADDVFGNWFRGFVSSVLANTFPVAREGAIRRSLELLGARLDRRFSVLIYPEGKLTVGGPTQPFKSGAGLLAVEGATQIVPMKLIVRTASSLLDRLPGGRLRGDVEVRFGDPLYFPAGTDHADATHALEAAVAAL